MSYTTVPTRVRYLSRPAFVLLIAYLTGILLSLAHLSYLYLPLIIVGGIGIIVYSAPRLLSLVHRRSRRSPVHQNATRELPSWTADLSLLIILTALSGYVADQRLSKYLRYPDSMVLHGTTLTLQHPIHQSTHPSRYSARIVLGGSTYHLYLSLDQEISTGAMYGGHITGDLKLYPLLPDGELPSDSYHRYLLSEGYHFRGYLSHPRSLSTTPTPQLLDHLIRFRQSLIQSFEQSPSAAYMSSEERGVLYAITLGDRSFITTSVRDHFAASGLSHLLAVSGFHLGVIYFFFAGLLRWLMPYHRHRRVRALLLIGILILYTLLCGASTATLRALTMSTLYLSATILDRPSDPIQILSLTALILLIIQPMSLMSVGLALSLSAVWGIFVFLPIFQYFLQASFAPLRYLLGIIQVSFAAQLGVYPFLQLYFGRVPMVSLWANIPGVVLTTLLIPYGTLLLFVHYFIGAPSPLLWLLAHMVRLLTQVTTYFGEISYGATVTALYYDLVSVVLYYAILHCIYLLLYRQCVYLHRRKPIGQVR